MCMWRVARASFAVSVVQNPDTFKRIARRHFEVYFFATCWYLYRWRYVCFRHFYLWSRGRLYFWRPVNPHSVSLIGVFILSPVKIFASPVETSRMIRSVTFSGDTLTFYRNVSDFSIPHRSCLYMGVSSGKRGCSVLSQLMRMRRFWPSVRNVHLLPSTQAMTLSAINQLAFL